MSAFENLARKVTTDPNSATELEWALYIARDAVEKNCLNKAAAELAAMRAQVQRLEAAEKRIAVLEKALKQTATIRHSEGIAKIINYHTGSTFDKCTSGYCMEAASALEGAK